MKLDEITKSNIWDDEIKTLFFNKLKLSKTNYNKSENCVVKALNIASNNKKYYINEALQLIDYSIQNFSDRSLILARAYSTKGLILEKYNRNFYSAFEYYTKWSELNTNLAGHEFDRLRSYLRYKKLKPDNFFYELFNNLKEKLHNLPTKQFRFWIAIFSTVLYSYENSNEDSKRLGQKAFDIYNEKSPTLLNQKFNNLKNVTDDIDITKEEIKILKKYIKKGFS
jgi:hypothetical protein